MNGIEVRPMTVDDVIPVAAIHLNAFPGFFLSFLGRHFLRELYRAIVSDDEGIAFVATSSGQVIGFVAGSASSSGFYRRAAKRRWWRFALASSGAVLRRPLVVRRLLRALYAPPKTSSEGALLMSLAVDPRLQGTGAGKALVAAFVDAAARRSSKAIVLTTDRIDNDAVNAFYRGLGFVVARDYVTPEGRPMNEYIRYI
ncbi:MAG TPA: GNAT family N-acetyltransferase [Thermoanaerobaculia bacterium]|nr:GNAT family N-acetyltransferase [Thermoanaerobaculia bacterium]